MSKLERITAFVNVVEENSFAAAARKQSQSTAAISRQVSQLEAELGAQLLQRTTRQITLTEIGLQYYQHVKKLLTDLGEAETSIAKSKNEATGTLSVMSSRYFAEEYIIPRLKKFMVQNPKLQIKLELAERYPDLIQEGIDLIFGVAMEGALDLVRRRVATTRYVLCASPDYLAKKGQPKTPADLKKHHFITHSMRKPPNRLTFKNSKELFIEPVLSLNDSRAMRECALQGMGIVMLHDYMVTDAVREGHLVELLNKFQMPAQTVYLYYSPSRYLLPKIRRFIDFYTAEN